MATWQLLLITLLVAVVLGCTIGILVGKYQVKKRSGHYKPLLSPKERIIFTVCVVVGIGCISLGLFYTPGGGEQNMQDNMTPGMGDMNTGMETLPEGETQPTDDAENPATDSDEATTDGENPETEEPETESETSAPASSSDTVVAARPMPQAGAGGAVAIIS